MIDFDSVGKVLEQTRYRYLPDIGGIQMAHYDIPFFHSYNAHEKSVQSIIDHIIAEVYNDNI